MAESEYHVASYVVTTKPDLAGALAEEINALTNMQVHACENGKLVVTAEAGSQGELADMAGILEQLETALVVSPVYHEFMTRPTNNQDSGSKTQ
jgi:nitrate reductase NapD